MLTQFREKLLGVALAAIGLGFVGWQHVSSGPILWLGGFVVLGGLVAVINAQALAAIAKQLETATSPNTAGFSGLAGSDRSSASSSNDTIDQAR